MLEGDPELQSRMTLGPEWSNGACAAISEGVPTISEGEPPPITQDDTAMSNNADNASSPPQEDSLPNEVTDDSSN
jgi:hypothetical protein